MSTPRQVSFTPAMDGDEIVWLFYKYVRVADPAQTAAAQRRLCTGLNLKGRLIIAPEGINGTLAGSRESLAQYRRELARDVRFADMPFKVGLAVGRAFPRLSVKCRKEIVSLQSDEEVEPARSGRKLSPGDWKRMIEEDPTVALLDVRNAYEFAVGHFEGAQSAGIENFRDLPGRVREFNELREKKVLMYCTGGVRCEKASALFRRAGFKQVYQLDGGILSYLQEFPGGAHWRGDCFVFDQRMVDPATDARAPIGICAHTGESTRHFVNCLHDRCHRLFLVSQRALAADPELTLCPECRRAGITAATAGCQANRTGNPKSRRGRSRGHRQGAKPREGPAAMTLGAARE